MPYQSTDELPEQTRRLTDKEKRAFMKAFNSAVSDGKGEQSAFRIAWKAAKQSGERSEDETTEKSMTEFRAVGDISKVDDDNRQVFGWASVVDIDGQKIVDKQNDWTEAEDLEKAAYDYVMSSRIGGTMHQREVDKSRPKATSTMIESFVVTPEKVEKMGLPQGSLPLGWWTGFQINDEQTWGLVKSGKLGSFSIHGSGRRTPADVSKNEKLGGSRHMIAKGELAENLARVWHLSGRDPVTFTKAMAVVADAAHERGLPSAFFYGQVVKHLIGTHEQKDHDPTKGKGHSRSQHEGLTRQYHGLPGSAGDGNGVIDQGMKEFGVSEQGLAEMFHASGAQDLDDLRAWKKDQETKRRETTSKRLQERDKQTLAKYLLE